MLNVKQTCLPAFLIGCSSFCFSQEKGSSVIAAAGGISKGGTIILEWTVGEPAVETLSSSSSLYTQGFHQPLLQVQKLSNQGDVAALKNAINVYPNPATSVINMQLEKASETGLLVSLIDGGGKVVFNNLLPPNSTFLKINVVRLSQGAYILRITDAKGTMQSDYKIIKAQ
jgi:hypothetical protein